ncbi:MAG: amidohydrolase family protein [Acidobacteria bacterium]|nr:amidohydrolase family protein [Acidobacteriota bacterium]
MRATKSSAATVFVFAVTLAVSAWSLAWAQQADLIVFNGKIATVDNNDSMVEAIAIRDDVIVAVGKNEDILKLAAPGAKKLDLRGKTVLPGLIDVHWHVTGFMPQDFPEVKGINVPPSADKGVVKRGIEETITKRVKEVKPGEWIIVTPTGDAARQLILYEEITRAELDRFAPDNPVMLQETGSGAPSQILLNTRAREITEKHFPAFKLFSDQDLKADGVNVSAVIVKDILLAGREETYAKSLKQLLMTSALPGGITTLGTRVLRTPLNSLFMLDRKGEMPMRFGWLFSDGSYYNPEGFYKRFPNMAGVGTKYLWSIGVGEEVTDSPSTALCTTMPIINAEFKGRLEKAGINPCFLEHPVKRAAVKDQIQYGRGVEYHASGDKTVDILLGIIDEIRRETGMSVEQIREKRLTMEHLQMVRPDQLPKLKEYGIIMADTPDYLIHNLDPTKPANVLRNYGEQYLGWYSPVKSFLDAGLRTVIAEAFGKPFEAMKLLVTREACFTPRLPGEGEIGVEKCRVLAPEQKIDRINALKMVTRWSAYYMLRENELGSLEVGKWADFVVLDRDYFTIPEKEIAQVKVLLTALGGKVVYTSSDFGPIDKALFKSPEYFGKAALAN